MQLVPQLYTDPADSSR